MADYVNLLLNAINMYDENDEKSKIRLRDLICIISEDKELKKDPLIKELLYSASNKMRVFGYNVQNGFNQKSVEIEQNNSELTALRNQAIRNRYQSEVRKNNILDKSQKELVEFFQSLDEKRMLVSAPTSYGKTFIMREILFVNRERYKNVLLVFPTVALLRENAVEMEQLNKEAGLGYKVIKSVDNKIDLQEKHIFVFTPERTMQLLSNYPNLNLDFFFYDEMYKIDEDYNREDFEEEQNSKSSFGKESKTFLDEGRAKTFRICLYFLSKKVPEYYLAGPNLREDKFGFGMKEYLKRNHIKVKEITFEPTKRIQVNAYNGKIEEKTSDMEYIEQPGIVKVRDKVHERLCDVIDYIDEKKYGATLLYCNTPSKANEYATKLTEHAKARGNNFIIKDHELEIFLKHIRRNYDINSSVDQWNFVKILEQGFGLHHGKMPKYIQKEVLKLFNNGTLKLLFCTSTIVEGVNTNAKNMIVLNNTKGREKLTVFDFKNIIGRAGRYYHNFVGRYFLFDKQLKRFETASDLQLNFLTYDEPKLSKIDIDNAEYEDITSNNQEYKREREEEQKDYLLTEEVFNKNRLIKKEDQEALLQVLIFDDDVYDKFYQFMTYPDVLKQFVDYYAMFTIFECCSRAKLLDENLIKRYKAIDHQYNTYGFKGLLKYEIDHSKQTGKSIDDAYMAAFRTKKEIIEHKFPKLLALFEALFARAVEFRGDKLEVISLSKVSRYYETGVKSYFGEQLIEYGFPVDAIKEIEDNNPTLISLDADFTKVYVGKFLNKIKKDLDEYECMLMDEALKSIL